MVIKELYADEKKIIVLDGIIEQSVSDAFYEMISKQRFARHERDFDEDKYPIFSIDLNPEKFETESPIGIAARHIIENIAHQQGYMLKRSYVNMCQYGDMEFPHRDCGIYDTDVTVLYYVNNKWDHSWGGETLFYENNEAKAAVSPRPGRFVFFYGAVEHVGTVPTRICSESRFSLALKYEKANQ